MLVGLDPGMRCMFVSWDDSPNLSLSPQSAAMVVTMVLKTTSLSMENSSSHDKQHVYHLWASGVKVLVPQSYPVLCDPVDCSPPSFSGHGILQARILEWVAVPFSRGSSWSRGWTLGSPALASRCFTIWATKEAFRSTYDKARLSFQWNIMATKPGIHPSCGYQ